MNKITLPKPPEQEWADLRQAIEWIAYGLKPIPLAYDKAIRGKIRNIHTTTKLELKNAKKVLFIALLEGNIKAVGNKGIGQQKKILFKDSYPQKEYHYLYDNYEQECTSITKDLWDIDNINWNENYMFTPNGVTYANIRFSSKDLYHVFPINVIEEVYFNKEGKLVDKSILSNVYISPYMQLMLEAINVFKITPSKQPLTKVLENWFYKKLKNLKGEINPSQHKAKMLATFVRLPESQKGGNMKSK